jgi:hypothetical protein
MTIRSVLSVAAATMLVASPAFAATTAHKTPHAKVAKAAKASPAKPAKAKAR